MKRRRRMKATPRPGEYRTGSFGDADVDAASTDPSKHVDRLWVLTAWGGGAGWHVGMTWTLPDGSAWSHIVSVPPKDAPRGVGISVIASPPGQTLDALRATLDRQFDTLKRRALNDQHATDADRASTVLEVHNIDGRTGVLVAALAHLPFIDIKGNAPAPETVQ